MPLHFPRLATARSGLSPDKTRSRAFFFILIIYFMIQKTIIFTILILLIYAAVQHDIRAGANDPQIQLAEDISAVLEKGGDVSLLKFPPKIDISKSLAPFLIIYDDSGKQEYSTAELGDRITEIPKGVLDYARAHTEDRLTWQPREDAREAIVVRHFGGAKAGFVAAGRSLREIETRENRLMLQVSSAWLSGLAVIVVLSLLKID